MTLKQLMRSALILLLTYCSNIFPAEQTAYISIIIDDVGYNKKAAKQLIALPQNLTISILPFSPHAIRIAKLAHKQHKEIMLHLPMESDSDHKHEPQTLMLEMESSQFINTLYDNLKRVPYIAGINNHMGSKLTSCTDAMNWLMTELASMPLYFIDSRTTTLTVAEASAENHNIPTLSRDIFLDNNRTTDKILQQFMRLKKLAKSKGFALAIGHPYPETYAVLSQLTPSLKDDNIELVPVSQLIQIKNIFNYTPMGAQNYAGLQN